MLWGLILRSGSCLIERGEERCEGILLRNNLQTQQQEQHICKPEIHFSKQKYGALQEVGRLEAKISLESEQKNKTQNDCFLLIIVFQDRNSKYFLLIVIIAEKQIAILVPHSFRNILMFDSKNTDDGY